jgi:hypothetical protein
MHGLTDKVLLQKNNNEKKIFFIPNLVGVINTFVVGRFLNWLTGDEEMDE